MDQLEREKARDALFISSVVVTGVVTLLPMSLMIYLVAFGTGNVVVPLVSLGFLLFVNTLRPFDRECEACGKTLEKPKK